MEAAREVKDALDFKLELPECFKNYQCSLRLLCCSYAATVTHFDSARPGWTRTAPLVGRHAHPSKKKKKSRVMARIVHGEIGKNGPNPGVIKFPGNLHYTESSQLY